MPPDPPRAPAVALRSADESQLMRAIAAHHERGGRDRAPLEALRVARSSGPLPAIPLFSELGPEAFVAVVESLRRHKVRAGQRIVREGDEASSMYAIAEGSVSIEREQAEGSVSLATMGEGEFFGEMALLAGAPRLATVRAREEAVLLEIMQDRIGQITAQHPSVGRVLERFYRRRMILNVLRSNPSLLPMFQGSLPELMAGFRARAVRDGTPLLKEGQRGSGLYILLRGECVVSRARPAGGEELLARLREGDVFGEISLLLGRPVTATVSARGACFVLRLSKEVFDAALARAPESARSLEALGRRRLEELGESSRPRYNV